MSHVTVNEHSVYMNTQKEVCQCNYCFDLMRFPQFSVGPEQTMTCVFIPIRKCCTSPSTAQSVHCIHTASRHHPVRGSPNLLLLPSDPTIFHTHMQTYMYIHVGFTDCLKNNHVPTIGFVGSYVIGFITASVWLIALSANSSLH